MLKVKDVYTKPNESSRACQQQTGMKISGIETTQQGSAIFYCHVWYETRSTVITSVA